MDMGSMGGGGGFDWGSKFGFGVKGGGEENPEFDKPKKSFGKELLEAGDDATSGPGAGKDLVAKNDPSRRAIGPALVSSWRGGRP